PMRVDALLRPGSIAVLGASARPSIGKAILSSLDTLGYRGDVLPVNPKYAEVMGRPCHASLRELPAAPDVVAFCVGGDRIVENLEMAARWSMPAASTRA